MDSPSSSKLRVKITYNIGGSSQLRLARLPATPVSLLDFSESSSGSSSTSLLGRYVELPLGVCLAAVKQASPELMSDSSQDYSVYVQDPTEDIPNDNSQTVLVGKGLLSSVIAADTETICGQVIKDGIRGESVLVQLVLERATCSKPAPPCQSTTTSQPQISQLQQAQMGNNSVDALLSFLNTVASGSQTTNSVNLQAPATGATPTEVTQLLSALANCCGLDVSSSAFTTKAGEVNASAPPSKSVSKRDSSRQRIKVEPEVIDITQDCDIVEVIPSSNPDKSEAPDSESCDVDMGKHFNKASAYYSTRVLAGYPPPGSAIGAQSSSSTTPASVSRGRGKSKAPTSSFPAPLSSIINAASTNSSIPPVGLHVTPPVPTMHARPTFQPAAFYLPPGSIPPMGVPPLFVSVPSLKNQKIGPFQPVDTSGPNGNGWYRRQGVPTVPSSDQVDSETEKPIKRLSQMSATGKENGMVAEKGKGKVSNLKKRASIGEPDEKARNKRMKRSQDEAEATTSPIRAGGTSVMAVAQCAATSPLRPRKAWKGKNKDLTQPPSSMDTPSSPSFSTKTSSSVAGAKSTGLSGGPLRALNILSNRPFARSQSDGQPYTMRFLSDELLRNQSQSRMLISDNPYLQLKTGPSSTVRSSGVMHSKETVYATSPSDCSQTPTPCDTPVPVTSIPLPSNRGSTPGTANTVASSEAPRTPPRNHQLTLPDIHQTRSKTASVVRMCDDVTMAEPQDSDDNGSPLFLPSPDDPPATQRRCSAGDPSSPTPTRRRPTTPKTSGHAVPQLSLTIPSSDSMAGEERSASVVEGAQSSTQDSRSDDEYGPPPAKPFDFLALELPPSSPPSSLASSEVSSSPAERWSSLEIDGEAEGNKGDMVAEPEPHLLECNVSSDSALHLTGMEPLSQTSDSSASAMEDTSMSTSVPSSDASSIEFDYDALMNMLGMCRSATNETQDMAESGKTQENIGLDCKPVKISPVSTSPEFDISPFLRSDPALEYLSYGRGDCSSSFTLAEDSMAVEPAGDKNDLSWLSDVLNGHKSALSTLPASDSDGTLDDPASGSFGFDDDSFKAFVDLL